jgi:hypothetical protein
VNWVEAHRSSSTGSKTPKGHSTGEQHAHHRSSMAFPTCCRRSTPSSRWEGPPRRGSMSL